MANNRAQELLKFANLQMAAEAFLDGFNTSKTAAELSEALERGNGHASRFTDVQRTEFSSTYETDKKIYPPLAALRRTNCPLPRSPALV